MCPRKNNRRKLRTNILLYLKRIDVYVYYRYCRRPGDFKGWYEFSRCTHVFFLGDGVLLFSRTGRDETKIGFTPRVSLISNAFPTIFAYFLRSAGGSCPVDGTPFNTFFPFCRHVRLTISGGGEETSDIIGEWSTVVVRTRRFSFKFVKRFVRFKRE